MRYSRGVTQPQIDRLTVEMNDGQGIVFTRPLKSEAQVHCNEEEPDRDPMRPGTAEVRRTYTIDFSLEFGEAEYVDNKLLHVATGRAQMISDQLAGLLTRLAMRNALGKTPRDFGSIQLGDLVVETSRFEPGRGTTEAIGTVVHINTTPDKTVARFEGRHVIGRFGALGRTTGLETPAYTIETLDGVLVNWRNATFSVLERPDPEE